MNIQLKLVLVVTVAFLCLTTISRAQTFSARLSAGADSINADVQATTPLQGSTLTVGGGGLYMEDDYSLLTLNAGLQQSLFDPALTLGLGFKGIIGEAEKNNVDFDVAAIGFSANAEYNLDKTPAKLPISVYTGATGAPDPLSFEDCTKYLEYYAGINIYLIENGALVAQYTRLEFDLEKSRLKTEKSENLFFLGMQFTLGY